MFLPINGFPFGFPLLENKKSTYCVRNGGLCVDNRRAGIITAAGEYRVSCEGAHSQGWVCGREHKSSQIRAHRIRA